MSRPPPSSDGPDPTRTTLMMRNLPNNYTRPAPKKENVIP